MTADGCFQDTLDNYSGGNMHRKNTVIAVAGLILLAVMAVAVDTIAKEEAKMPDSKNKQMTDKSYLDIPFNTISGEKTSLRDFSGKVLLLVNTASKCGFTPQYAGLEKLYETYKDSGLVVIGFPANNFGEQEPGTDEEIQNFCQTKYDVTFPMMSKISVKGKDKHPLFVYLTEKSPITGEIQWNFSKFLIDRNGNLVARFPSQTKPSDEELVSKIKELL
jgi:glutathione peroxidase